MLEEVLDDFDLDKRQQQSHQALLRQLKQELREKDLIKTPIRVEVGYGSKASPSKHKVSSPTAHSRFV